MAELLVLLNEFSRRQLARGRRFMERTYPLDIWDDFALLRKYRFPKASILEIIEECRLHLERTTNKSHALPVHSQVLTALRFFAKGIFQEDAGELLGLSQPSASRALDNVCKILALKAEEEFRLPESPNELQTTMEGFSKISGFPRIIGLIDGTHVKIRSPTKDVEALFVCRKTGHSVNVQVICDYNMMFTGIVAKYGGSTHDAFIWKYCGQRDDFLENPPKGWLLGDSGYALEPWLLTPLLNPANRREEQYNAAFTKTRNKVECAIGLWKSVFRCIDLSGGHLQYAPKKVCQIILATAILPNRRRRLRLPQDENFEIEPEENVAKLVLSQNWQI